MDKANQNELTFRKGEIFNVRDTMYQGLIGYWQAQRVGKNGQMLERGVLPNKSRYLYIIRILHKILQSPWYGFLCNYSI